MVMGLVFAIPGGSWCGCVGVTVPIIFYSSLGVAEFTMASKVTSRGFRDRCKVRAYKVVQSKKCYVVDSDNLMEKVSSLIVRALVGRLEYYRMDTTG